MDVQTLYFDEEILLDYTSMPVDDSEGAQHRDIELSEALYSFEEDDSLSATLDLADVLQVGV